MNNPGHSSITTGWDFRLPLALLALFFTILAPLAAPAKDPLVVRVGYYENPPKLYRSENNRRQGIFPEILRIIARAENWQLQWVDGSWNQGLARLEAGEIDIMPDVAYSSARAEKYAFSTEPVFINWGILYTRPDVQIRNLLDLEGKRVAVMRGSIHTDGADGIKNLARDFHISCEFVELESYQAVFQALQDDLADAGVVNRLFGTTAQHLYDVQPTSIVFNPRHVKFAFPKNSPLTPRLRSAIDHYLADSSSMPDSRVQSIIQAYLSGAGPDRIPEISGNGPAVFLTPEEKEWISSHPVITVGIDREFAPFEFLDRNGQYSGFASDYLQLLSRRLGLHLSLVRDREWTEIMNMAEQGEIDLLPAIGFSRHRASFLSYTIPYTGFYRMFLARSDIPFIAGVKDLEGLRVAVQAQSSHAAWIREHTSLTPIYYDTLEETLQAVADGEADTMIGNLAACSYWIRRLNLTNIRIDAPVSLQRQLLYMGVRKDWPQLVQIINKGLQSITAREHEEIRNRWLAAGYTVGISRQTFWKRMAAVLLAALFIISCFLVWNRWLHREILARKKAEQELLAARQNLVDTVRERTRELEENRHYLQAIFDAPNEAIFVHDGNTGEVLDVNATMLRMFGLDHDQALRASIGDLSSNEPPHTEEEALERIQQTLKQGPQTFEWLCRHAGGHCFWAEIGLSPVTINNRAYVIAVVRNIDNRKKSDQALAAERERLAVTLRSIADGVITTDTRGEVILVNRAAEAMTGWSQQEARNRPAEEIFSIVDETTGEPCDGPVRRVLESHELSGIGLHTLLIARDGSRRNIACNAAPIRDWESNIIGVVLVFRDITSERRLEEEMLKIRKLESIGVLAGGIAHDFNNFLTAILGNMELAHQLIGSGHKATPLLENALKATERATRLTGQLLTFAKGGDPVKEATSLEQLIRDSTEFVLHGSTVTCSFDFPPDLWLVEVDSGQLSQVIQNIIINARHAMPDGGRIQVRAANIPDGATEFLLQEQTGRFVKLEITDNGIGIPPNWIDKIFDPYFSTKSQGSGLGLAICHSIISKHGGRISASSTPGKGTTFTIFLPASDKAQTVDSSRDAGITPSGPLRILVMDDDPMVRDIAASQLSHLGHQCLCAADGEEALALYKQSLASGPAIDILIMDLTIPGGMGGRETVTRVLALDPEARVIVASGYSTDPVLADHREYGFRASICKPFNLRELQRVIQEVMAAAA